MNKKTNTERYEALQKQLLKACFNKYTPATNNRVINKIAAQLRYLERGFIGAERLKAHPLSGLIFIHKKFTI